MDRRAFLRRLGLGMAAVAAAPTLLAAVAPAEANETRIPLTVTFDRGGRPIDDGGYEMTCSTADWNDWPPGVVDCITTSSVHGLSTSTKPEWKVARRARRRKRRAARR